MTAAEDVQLIREAMSDLDRVSAWAPTHAPMPEEILTPSEHRNALDLDRTIVIGNRGVGKTFWSQALVDPVARQHVANAYPKLGLQAVDAELGFSSGYATDTAASERTIADAERVCSDPARIWEAVLLRLCVPHLLEQIGPNLRNIAGWLQENAERGEKMLRQVDDDIALKGRRLLLVFDGLDALGTDWATIRHRLGGLIRFARLAKSFRAIRLKIFLRIDQAQDYHLWQSPDASKLFNEKVSLSWDQRALYELLFFHLQRKVEVKAALERLIAKSQMLPGWRIVESFRSPIEQQRAFSVLAGPSMGSGTNRGNTYNWVVNHLADANGETTPRAFLVALSSAAKHATRSTVIDHLAIQAGVREASVRRLREIEEDHWWVSTAFEPLTHAHVPCEMAEFSERWKSHSTAQRIRERARRENRLPPLLLDLEGDFSDESRLLAVLTFIGVIELRKNNKINVPDIFRLAAGLKRKGGVKPPPKRSGG